MIEVKLNKSNDNPFYGLRNCLQLQQSVLNQITPSMLDLAYAEVKGDKVKREMFYSLLFSIGDITERQHNIFKGVKRDSGGNSNRQGFITIFDWLYKNNREQFKKFLEANLFTEYTCFDLLFRSRVKTLKNRVVSVTNLFTDEEYCGMLAQYIYKVVNGTNPFNKLLVAKFLTLPRMTKRSGHKQLLDVTKRVMVAKAKFLAQLSDLMGWEYDLSENYANFKGYRAWRKQYNSDLESVLFTTGKINEFDKTEFINWLDKLPSQARFRVKNRILYSKTKDNPDKNKWDKFIAWYKEWEQYKLNKQAESRKLEEKVRQGQATEDDKIKLEKVKKQAKVNIGATNFKEIYESIKSGRVDELKVESFINKVNLPYNSLVIIDDSGSMRGAPFNFAKFIAAVCLVKNPDDDGRNLLGFFNSISHWHSYIDQQAGYSPNSIMRTQVASIKKTPFVDPNLSFMENYRRISSFCDSVFRSGGTNISAIPEGLNNVCVKYPEVLDALRNYPVWTIISDGEWNNLRSPEASLNDFFRRCECYFGFRPYIVAIDVPNYGNPSAERFSGIDNFMYIPANPALIEQFLTNFKDMDVFDVYTPLQSIYRSNRYDLVRENTL